jgi:site-specific recombinase XerD
MLRPITLTRALEIVGQLHVAAKTAEWYRSPIHHLINQLGDVPVHTITREDIDKFHKFVLNNGYSPWTVESYTRATKAFFNHLIALGHLETSPAAHLRRTRLPHKKPKEIDLDEIRLMIQHSRHSLRDYAMILALADSGCRVGELASMTVSKTAFNQDGGRAIVRGKGHKTRFIFFTERTAVAIADYLTIRPVYSPDDLWLGTGGDPLLPGGIYQALRRIGKRAGVRRMNPHAFRHAAAKRWLDDGMPARAVQELLGHEDVTTTLNLYVSYTDDELQAHHSKHKPTW